jgi:hypothetical protein
MNIAKSPVWLEEVLDQSLRDTADRRCAPDSPLALPNGVGSEGADEAIALGSVRLPDHQCHGPSAILPKPLYVPLLSASALRLEIDRCLELPSI